MSSTDIYYHINIINNITIYIYKYVLPVIYISGNIGNLLSLLIFFTKSWKKNVCVFYFKSCLVFNTCYINCTTLGFIFINGFQINIQNSNIILCKLFFYGSFLFAMLSPTILILASIDRLLISSQNIDTRLYSSKRLAYFSISISIIFWIIFNIHILIRVNIQQPYPSYFYCYYDASQFYGDFVAYSSSVIHTIFFLSMIILCLLAFKNVRHIRSQPREQRTNQLRSMTKKDFQLLRCLYVQDIIFIIFGMLLILYYIYYAITKDHVRTILEVAVITFLNKFFTSLYTIPFATNFFVFLVVSKAFRCQLKRMIYKIFGKKINPIREEENRQKNDELNVVSTIVLSARI